MRARPALSEAATWTKRPCDTLATVFLGLALSMPFSLSGQTFQGQVTDGSSLAPVTGALVRLISEDGGERGSAITGTFSISMSPMQKCSREMGPHIWEVPGYRIEMSPFGGIKDSGLGYKEGVIEAMKSFTNLKTFSMPWM